MPQYVVWDPAMSTGHERLDAQHAALLAQCNRLADLCSGRDGAADEVGFDQALAQLKALAREHLEVEAALAGSLAGDPAQDPAERDEFAYLIDEIATPANFDRLELQRFLAVWWLGHVRGMAAERAASVG